MKTHNSKMSSGAKAAAISVVAVLMIGLTFGILLKIGSIAPVTRSSRPAPRGQFAADVRTLISGIRFILDFRPGLRSSIPATGLFAAQQAGQAELPVTHLICQSNLVGVASDLGTNTAVRG